MNGQARNQFGGLTLAPARTLSACHAGRRRSPLRPNLTDAPAIRRGSMPFPIEIVVDLQPDAASRRLLLH